MDKKELMVSIKRRQEVAKANAEFAHGREVAFEEILTLLQKEE